MRPAGVSTSIYLRLTAAAMLCLLALTSVGSGMARGQAQVAGQMVICSGHGTVTVWVDAEGQPVERQVPCPDCVVSLFSAVPPAPVSDPLHSIDVHGVVWRSAGSACLHADIAIGFAARAPPEVCASSV